MARIYNPTMLMLDPSNVMNAVRLGREREAQEQEARKGIAQGIGEIGGALAGIGGRALRQSEIGELPEDADDEWKAVVERFVDTGDISGINAYKQRKAEEAYRDKMLALQKLQAKGAKSASEASLAEAKQKDKDILQGQAEDALRELNDARIRYSDKGGGVKVLQAKNDYEYARKKLKRLYKQLGIPEDEIPELEIGGEENVAETAEGGTEKPSSTASVELRLKERFEKGFDDYSDINEFVEDVEEAQKKSISAEESDKLSELKTKALKSIPRKEKDRRALKAKVKDAIKFENMSKADKFSLKEEEYNRLNDNYANMIQLGNWEELKKKYGSN